MYWCVLERDLSICIAHVKLHFCSIVSNYCQGTREPMRNHAALPCGGLGCQVREMSRITKETHMLCHATKTYLSYQPITTYSRMLFTFHEMLSMTKESHKSCATPCNQDLSVMPAYHHSSRMFWTLTLLGVLKAVAGILVTNHQTFLFSFEVVGILTQVWLLLILAWNLNIHL